MWYSLIALGVLALFGFYAWRAQRKAIQSDPQPTTQAKAGGGGGPTKPVPPR